MTLGIEIYSCMICGVAHQKIPCEHFFGAGTIYPAPNYLSSVVDRKDNALEERLVNIEAKLDKILDKINHHPSRLET